jgi:hypothetical protein
MTERPSPSEYAPFYAGYIALAPAGDILDELARQQPQLGELAAGLTPEQEQLRYADGKWSVREVFGHLIDAERVFGYRAFCIGRGDSTPLPGFDENRYVAASGYDASPLRELAAEFALLRAANLAGLRRLEDDDWRNQGIANGVPVSVRALAFIMAGHVNHHLAVLRQKYAVG